jgi:hypothetical protein
MLQTAGGKDEPNIVLMETNKWKSVEEQSRKECFYMN